MCARSARREKNAATVPSAALGRNVAASVAANAATSAARTASVVTRFAGRDALVVAGPGAVGTAVDGAAAVEGGGDVAEVTGDDDVDVGAEGEALIAVEDAARRVNAGYVIDAAPGPDGPIPDHIKDRIRAAGPTVRTDLGIHPELRVVKA